MSILTAIQEAAKESNAFENHPAKELSLEERLLYLQGLSLVMNSDGEIHPEETDYLLILIRSLDLDESVLESCIEFAKQPDKNTIQSILKTFRRKPIAQLFIFDALMLSSRDGVISEQEKEVLVELSLQLEIKKGNYGDIYDLFCHIKNKDWESTSVYFSGHLLNQEYFKHILSYFDVDYSDLILRSRKINKSRIIKLLRSKISDKNYVNEIFLPFLQSKIDSGLVSVENGLIHLSNQSTVNVEYLGYSYNKEMKFISIKESKTIHDESFLSYFMEDVGISEKERYLMEGRGKEIITSRVDSENARVLILDKPLKSNKIIDINGSLWVYNKSKQYDLYDRDCIVCTDGFSFIKSIGLDEIPLQYSLKNRKINSNRIGFLSSATSVIAISSKTHMGVLIKYYGKSNKKR